MAPGTGPGVDQGLERRDVRIDDFEELVGPRLGRAGEAWSTPVPVARVGVRAGARRPFLRDLLPVLHPIHSRSKIPDASLSAIRRQFLTRLGTNRGQLRRGCSTSWGAVGAGHQMLGRKRRGAIG